MTGKKYQTALVVVALLFSLGTATALERKVGLIENDPAAFDGYTLFAPLFSKTTYLIDMQGRVVHTWECEFPPGLSAYLLENGHLLRTAAVGPRNRTFFGRGAGGRVQEVTWDGEIVWDFEYSSATYLLHHDVERLPNGNVLMIAWERRTEEEALSAGRDPDLIGSSGLWSDHIIEVKPTGETTGEIVWQWHVWDHMIQDYDPDASHHGVVSEHPELININPVYWTERLSRQERERLEALGYLGSGPRTGPSDHDWVHTNSIAYNAELDQIVLSVLAFNEIWIIDHSTTTEEAAGHTGGRCGKGGDLVYRFGNPQVWGGGAAADQRLFAQHDAHWIPRGCEGAGEILLFNNGRGRPGGDHSSVDQFALPKNDRADDERPCASGFAPAGLVWSYAAQPKNVFYSTHISGAQRLPNGNTLICSGEKGIIFEVTRGGEVVWKYVNPIFGNWRRGHGGGRAGPRGVGTESKRSERREASGSARTGRGAAPGMGRPRRSERQNCVFRAYRYGPEFASLIGKDLQPGETIEATLRSEADPPAPLENAGTGEAARFIVCDEIAFDEVVTREARVVKLAGGMEFTEGPVWVAEGRYLLFSDIPADEIKKWQDGRLTTFRKPSHHANGNLLDRQGRLLTCEHGSRSVTRTAKNGKVEALVDRYEGRKLNSPNDLAVRSDGMIWFTDPPYGLKNRSKELNCHYLFRFLPGTGALVAAIGNFDRPNGVCLSPDEKRLYVADSGKPRHIRVFDMFPDGSLSNSRVFCTIDSGAPDGIRCDRDGRLWSSAGDGVHVFSRAGKLLGKILVPESPSNLCFGGNDGKMLFITARTSLYFIRLRVPGSLIQRR